MSRYNWYSLKQNGKVIGSAGALGQADWRDDIYIMEYFQINLEKLPDGEIILDEFEIIRDGHELGPVEPEHRGYGKANFTDIPPPRITKNTLLFEYVKLKRI